MYTELLMPLSRVFFLTDSCDEYIPLCHLQISALSPLGMETKLKVSSTDSLLHFMLVSFPVFLTVDRT